MDKCHNLDRIAAKFNTDEYINLNEEISFAEYLDKVYANPVLIRTAYQRLHDMIASDGVEEIYENKEKLYKYNFFSKHEIPIFGLHKPLNELVKFFKGAAGGYGTEKRVLLLHGPVGSSKSTILRLIKSVLEKYSATDPGAWYSFKWINLPTGKDGVYTHCENDCPMHEEPLKLIPKQFRKKVVAELNEIHRENHAGEQFVYDLTCIGELDPRCRKFMKELLAIEKGDWKAVVNKHIRVVRKVHSEADRCGIATFQPKDEKNQDATELTGDIDFGKIGHFGADSDARAFSFDGEFCVGNRGIVEFIEMLKLAQEFLYDLLGASQERQIKPKKFSQISIDEAIIGHSVDGNTPIFYRHGTQTYWTTLKEFFNKFENDTNGVEVLAYDFEEKLSKWTSVNNVIRHKFTGTMYTTSQKWGMVSTTPNHSIYNRLGEEFYPIDRNEIMAVRENCLVPNTAIIDISEDIPELVSEKVSSFIVQATSGRSRLNEPRFATDFKTIYDPVIESDALEDFLVLLIWYATEGHVNDDGSVVISQANKDSLIRVQECVKRISSTNGHISGPHEDGCYRLIFNAKIFGTVLEKLCGRYSENKRLPDFIFGLSNDLIKFTISELMKTDGSRKVSKNLVCSESYKSDYFEYKTVSPVLAAQVGVLSASLGFDYSVYDSKTVSGKTAYKIRYVSGTGKQGGRQNRCECKLYNQEVKDIWVYDIECKGLHNFVCGVGSVVCHNTNNPEYERLKSNQYMEALKDRTVKIDIPYLLSWTDEGNVLSQDYGPGKVRQHVAPHTLEIASLWCVLTRLEDDKDGKLTLVQKARLYNGEILPGYTEDTVKELKDKHPNEGLKFGVSARYAQDKISNCLSNNHDYISPFMVMHEIKEGLGNNTLINKKEELAHYYNCVDLTMKELDEILKDEVRKALVGDEKVIERLCANYIENILAYIRKSKVKNKFTGRDEPPNERLMRSIEEKISVPDQGVDDFRRTIAAFIGDMANSDKKFRWDSNSELKKALEAKLFEDTRDHIKLSALNVSEATVVQPDIQEKIDQIKKRLIDQYGYNDKSASDVLDYVGSLFARTSSSDD